MLKRQFWALALAGAFVVPNPAHAQFADAVTAYNPGTGFATGFTNTSAAIGAPALGGSVTPFAPPFSKSQIVSIGAGGEITMQFNTPIMNNPADPYGINFILFANSFFVSSGGNVSGLFSHAVSATVQVSQDGLTWFALNPALAPAPGQLFPTDGAGNPQIPVNPSLTLTNFTGDNLTGIRSLYAGSAGGTGYDLAWAEDGSGNSVNLPDADFVRIEVQSGVLDLDAASETAVPEVLSSAWLLALMCGVLFWCARQIERSKLAFDALPRRAAALAAAMSLLGWAATSNARAGTLTESFTNNPALDGWQIFGDTNLFSWNATNHNLAVTWDSSQPNSYFYHAISPVLGEQDGFTLDFDLNLTNAVAGGDGFELGIGFIHLADATGPDFFRGSGYQSPNLVEFDYFPPTTNYGASIDATMVDAEDDFNFFYDDTLGLTNGTTYHVTLDHTVGSAIISTTVYTYDTNGVLQLYTSLPGAYLATPFNDFFLDAISISSYSDENGYGATIFAQGTIGNIVVTTAPRPIGNLTGGFTSIPITTNSMTNIWQTQFTSRMNWSYTLVRSTDLQSWSPVSPPVSGTGATLTLQDTNAPADKAFYQVQASQ